MLASVLALLLTLAGWRVLLAPPVPVGEGAAAGVVVVQLAIWFAGAMCCLLALVLLGSALHAHPSPLVAVALGCVIIADAVLVHRLLVPDTPAQRASTPRELYAQGYAWAIDNGITSASACVHENADFRAGCIAAARAH